MDARRHFFIGLAMFAPATLCAAIAGVSSNHTVQVAGWGLFALCFVVGFAVSVFAIISLRRAGIRSLGNGDTSDISVRPALLLVAVAALIALAVMAVLRIQVTFAVVAIVVASVIIGNDLRRRSR